MYYIDLKKDKPDIGRMEATMDRLMTKGIRLADCNELKTYYAELRETLKNDISEKYYIKNPNSPAQIVDFLKVTASTIDLNSKNDIINICYNSEDDKWTTNAEALGKLADLGYEFARDILDYRHVKKYAESIESITEAADENGLIHPTVSLGKTHRVNYSNPGLLTIPKKLLWYIIAPYTKGNVLYSIDIKNQEPNILINITGANELKPALESKDGLYETLFKQCFVPKVTMNVLIDTLPENRVYEINELKQIGTISPASYSAAKPAVNNIYYNDERVVGIETVCAGSEKGLIPQLPETISIETEKGNIYSVKVTWDMETVNKKYKRGNDYSVTGTLDELEVRVSKAERKEFKTAWLAISYGASIFGIKLSCKIIDGATVYNFATKVNGLKEYRSKIDALAKEGNSIIGTAFGTPLNAGYYDDWKKLKRVLLDLPIQGTGADILSLLINRFYDYTTEHSLDDKMYLYYTRHDELIIEVDQKYLSEIGNEKMESILRDMLEHQINDWSPFHVEIQQVGNKKVDISEIEDDED